ncbi:YggT family protein [Brevundimonas lenta]|uniref:YggT family protein n=1 Tax=Brevundimonas lenta TaxID=424796 RepID=A0A7W6J9T5_9CAUL|nr:YggT family protein [Brevundimonas lenta]MBB4081176.1 YggT family protein [Brevundimonas lenta]
MAAIIEFVFFIIETVLRLFVLALIINAVLSWLFAFDVINYRNRFVASLAEALDRIVSPVLAPLRRVIPPLGGIDITPIVAWILIAGIQRYLLPASKAAMLSFVPY